MGALLHEGWLLKRELAATISNGVIDALYEQALASGAYGGKLCGAGSGGFLLFVAPPERHGALRAAFSDLIELHVAEEVHGSSVAAPFA